MATPVKMPNGINGHHRDHSITSPVPFAGPARGSYFESDNVSASSKLISPGRRSNRRSTLGMGSSRVSETISVLKRRSASELGAAVSGRIFNSSFNSLMEIIRHERLSKLPPEGSSWDKVLAWAQLFAERLQSFDLAIEQFAADSERAAQMAYGYCALLLELGHENALALQASFGFFYSCSLRLEALLDRTELFGVSSEIRDHLVMSYTDLITLISEISTHYHRAIRGMTGSSVSVELYQVFSDSIDSFRSRCDRIAEEMWKFQMSAEGVIADDSTDIKTLREWLAPDDRILANLAGDHAYLSQDREELTCIWFQPYLTRFLRDGRTNLAVTGKPGSGKTVLAGTVVDRLHRAVGKKSYATVFVPINNRIPTSASSLSVVQSILNQLFEQRIGNMQLYHIIAELYKHAQTCVDLSKYEEHLWQALDGALGKGLQGTKELVIVVDGLDEVSTDPKMSVQLFERLQSATSKHSAVKLITFSQAFSVPPSQTSKLEILDEQIYDDIFSVTKSTFHKYRIFAEESPSNQEIICHRITEASQGSFLWAKLTVKSLTHEESADAFHKAVDAVVKSARPITDIVQHQLQSVTLGDEAKMVLIWLMTAERPLTIQELITLLTVDVSKNSVVDRPVNLLHTLKPVAALIFIQDGLVYLRHGLIRTALKEIFTSGKYPLPVKDFQVNLVQRLLIYIRTALKDQHEPSFTPLSVGYVTSTFNQYPLLEYGVRYWIAHLSFTSLFKPQGEMSLPKDFKSLYPETPTFALIQRTCWNSKPAPLSIFWHDVVARIVRQTYGQDHPTVLQSLINCGYYYETFHDVSQTANVFYLCTKISRSLFGVQHVITTQCATRFLDVTTSMTSTSRTETMTRREETLLTLIESYKVQFGLHSELVIETQQHLVELYKSMKEETKANEMLKIMYTATTTEYGSDSREAKGIAREYGVTLRGHKEKTDVDFTELSLFGEQEEDELIVERGISNIEILLREAQELISKGQAIAAEQKYVEAWQLISRHSRHHNSVELEAHRMDVVMAYASFLKSEKRESESAALLTSLWQEHQHNTSYRSEKTVTKLAQVAKMMKTVGLTAVSLAIFKSCASFFSSTGRTSSSVYQEVQQQQQSTSRELLQQSASSSGSSSVVSESVLEEIITHASSSEALSFDASSYVAVEMLSTRYIEQHRWYDAKKIIKKSLSIMWPALFSSSYGDIVLPTKSFDECWTLAQRLVTCYERQRKLERVEDLRLRFYKAARHSRKIDDKLTEQTFGDILRVYERNDDVEKIISLREEQLADHKKLHGVTSPHVVKLLFTLADLTPRSVALTYYKQIVDILVKDSIITDPEAFEPLLIIAQHHWDERRWTDALWAYKILFTTFTTRAKDFKQYQEQGFVKKVYERYARTLKETHVDISVMYQLTKEYRETVIKTFSATSNLAVQATLALARICQQSLRYEKESITLYEELLKSGSSEVDKTEIQAYLNAIYEEQAMVATRSATSSSSSESAESAVAITRRRHTKTIEQYGWAHSESLSQLKEMSCLYAKQSKSQAAVEQLTEATRQIVSKESSATKLVEAATAIAASFIAAGEIKRAIEMKDEMHRQIVAKDTRNVKTWNFDFSSKSRQSAVFLAQMEYELRQDTTQTFSEIFAAIITEQVYFEQYRQALTSSTSVETVFIHAARLHAFLVQQKRTEMFRTVETELTEYFFKREASKAKFGDAASVRVLVVTILEYLQTHRSKNFVRSVSISGTDRVRALVKSKHYREACELALATFKFVLANGGYSSATSVKHGFFLSTAIAGRDQTGITADVQLRKSMLDISSTCLKETLRICKELKINLAHVALPELNSIIGLLGEQKDYVTLEWLLSLLWNTREAHRGWRASVSFALGHRLILARYLIGSTSSALRLAEDIAYNLRRVHGAKSPATLDMQALLSQLYNSVGNGFQAQAGGASLARGYYKKAAAVHENILRSLCDENFSAEEEEEMQLIPAGAGMDESLMDLSYANGTEVPAGELVRKHMQLMKLALERFGGWPKDYAEYERLNADAFRLYPADLKGFEGVEKWNVKSFGGGKAESNDGLLNAQLSHWEILDTRPVEIEEEL